MLLARRSIGYRRESSRSESVDEAYDYQERRLRSYGCESIFGDRKSGRKQRDGLKEAVAEIKDGKADELVVTHLFRLGRSMEAYKVIQQIESLGGCVTR